MYLPTLAQIVRGQFNSLVCQQSKMSIKNKISIYRMVIRPAMMYGSVIWANVSNTQLQNKFLRGPFNAPWIVGNTLHREASLPTIKEFLHDVARTTIRFQGTSLHIGPTVESGRTDHH
jgi:hypothetical protein